LTAGSAQFVDIHSHILHGLDDGAKTLEESLSMLDSAAESGTTDIVATPHCSPDYTFDAQLVGERVEELRQANRTPVKIHAGCDFHLNYDFIQDALENPRKYSINRGPYLLIELPERVPLKSIPSILDSLQRKGLIPILTHPERYYFLRGKVDEILEWTAGGCLVQVTGQSLTGLFGSTARKMAEQLMDRQAVHFIASDAHDLHARTTRLAETYGAIADRWGESRAIALMDTNPRATLTGDPLPAELDKADRRHKGGWLKFWR